MLVEASREETKEQLETQVFDKCEESGGASKSRVFFLRWETSVCMLQSNGVGKMDDVT